MLNKVEKQQIESTVEAVVVSNNESEQTNIYCFDNSVIPEKLFRYIETNIDSLRIPVESDYEIEYFRNKKINKLPYFTSGYFNEDTLTDYAMVLIKDSTMHYVFSFHSFVDTFKSYMLSYGHFSSEYNSNKIYAVFDIESDSERILEGIDTVYNLKTDMILISNIYESMTGPKVWNEKKQEYDWLYFD